MRDHRIPPLPLYPDVSGKFLPPIVTDPLGSYSGRPSEREDRPVQDADDL